MSNYPVGRPPRSADPQSRLRLTALTAVIAGVVLLAAAAFVLSYSGIHHVALQAGVSANLAKLYPVIFDAMLVIAGAAAMALRGAGWWSRFYAWACLIALLVAVAIGDAVYATGTVLPVRATRAAVAITPWVLLLLAFGLLLTMLRYFRKARAAVVARQDARAAAAVDAGTGGQPGETNASQPGQANAGQPGQANAGQPGETNASQPGQANAGQPGETNGGQPGQANGGQPGEANGTAAGRTVVTWSAAGAAGTAGTAAAVEGRPLPPPLSTLDMLLGPKPGQAPAIEAPGEADAAGTGTGDDSGQAGDDSGQAGDPVSYGEETGYVHPDSYRNEGEYSPHGDSGGPGSNGGAAYLGQEEPAGDYDGPGGALPDSASADSASADSASAGNGGAGNGGAGNGVDGSQGQKETEPQAVQADAAPGAAPGDGPAGEHAGDDAGGDANGETAADDGPGPERLRSTLETPGLERLRSTPTRPQE